TRVAPGLPAAVIQRFWLWIVEHRRALKAQRPVKILAPQQFFFQPAAVLVCVVYGLPALNAGPYLPDGSGAPGQPRAELAGKAAAGVRPVCLTGRRGAQLIAGVFIVAQGVFLT